MKVLFNDNLYIVHWKHERFTKYTNFGEKVYESKGGFTFCNIQKGIRPNQIALNEGRADCSKRDTFCKAVGRKVSLSKAVQTFSKEMRTAIWEAYRRECRG